MENYQFEEMETHSSNFRTFRFSSIQPSNPVFSVDLCTSEHFNRNYLQFRLQSLPTNFKLNSFGIKFTSIHGIQSILRNGYHSWDGSSYITIKYDEISKSDAKLELTGYAMTQLIPEQKGGSLVIGFDRHDQFQHTFTFSRDGDNIDFSIQELWDQIPVQENEMITSEKLWIIEHDHVEAGLRDWAQIVALSSPIAPRLPEIPMTGWCSWYNLYASIDQNNILEHLDSTTKIKQKYHLDLNIFQIDDGFTPEMGDWLEVKPQFPLGMKYLMDQIKASGFIPGLWIAPFAVGNRSHLFQDHPDWVIKDRSTGKPLVQMQFYGEFRWHKRSEEYYILDCTHPQAIQYLKDVFSTWHNDWGCDYFKTDFMFFGSEYGPERAVYHTPGLSRIQIWRKTAEVIRESIGDALWVGCGCPLWASVGLIEAVRIGRDMGVSWKGERAASDLLQDLANRNFGNQILWQTDPDCILLRNKFHHLNEIEIRSLAIYAGMTGGVMMTSDKLDELSSDRINIFTQFARKEKRICDFPLLGRSNEFSETDYDPIIVQIQYPISNPEHNQLLFIFNSGEEPVKRFFDLDKLKVPKTSKLINWSTGDIDHVRDNELTIELKPHDGVLYLLSS
ncbi:MAG: alpha-galactosidase [Anaerolineaceae bacterium]|nr:alpha-galactosidase [Anaerolineaceae bacterium]